MRKKLIIYIILSGLASAINYITYPTLARILPSSQYIDITVALSLFTQMSTFLSSIIAIAIGLSKSHSKNEAHKKTALLQSVLFKLFAVIILIFLTFSPYIMGSLAVPLEFTLPISLLMLISIPIAIISGFLNGRGKLARLGILTVMSAALQFSVGLVAATLTHSGFVAMVCMSAAQVLTVVIAYRIFADEKLPPLTKDLFGSVAIEHRAYVRKLVIFTFCSSLAVMAINIIQIADLLIIQALQTEGAKFYTDIYVISRVVFFGGMIFIWPFLSELSVTNKRDNYRPFYKLLGYFTLIGLGAVVGFTLFGGQLLQLLFGNSYSSYPVQLIGVLSIAYKIAFLILTTIVLYFIVLRRYTAVWLAFIATAGILLYSSIAHEHSIENTLIHLSAIAVGSALLSLLAFARHRIDASYATH